MDIDAFVAAHRAEWQRLDELVKRRRHLSGAEADELVDLYQRVATHLSTVRSAAPDPTLVSRLSQLVTRARSAVTGAHTPAWRDAARFLTVTFPAIAYRCRWWWLGASLISLIVMTAVGGWVAGNPRVQRAVAPSKQIKQLVRHDFENYYSAHPAGAFAAHLWTHNAQVAALSLILGIFLCVPTLYLLWQNAYHVGQTGGLMFAYGKGGTFFGLILPHGLLELTAVFLAAATGMRLGWTVIDPGLRRRGQALAEEGRAAVAVAIGLVLVLLVSGVIEAFVTPSPLPTAARIGIGVTAEVGFLAYVIVLGRRAVRAGDLGDLAPGETPDRAPTAG